MEAFHRELLGAPEEKVEMDAAGLAAGLKHRAEYRAGVLEGDLNRALDRTGPIGSA